MLMLVSYDVNTVNAAGRRRLRRIAKACEDWGIRVQNSVFECSVDWSQWIALKSRLESICDPAVDSLRYYNLGNSYKEKVVHYGAKPTVDPAVDALIV
ncbi:MAG: CRISPR-associated endonuclease Cas2 [Kiritimatiellae bacterium]|nr:CRISPR-associated endonuclease Cas2 [Kiritimatiellia bacterium]